MASGTRSSKRKSSPSHSLKKKRRNKDRGKKRSKIDKRKSKKVSRCDSPDTNTNDESLSDSSVSCSGADFDHGRSRSRIRKDREQCREKSRRRSSKREKGKDTIQVRKSKVLKTGRDKYGKRKRRGKMHKRKPSTSSSSGSLSCSTCESSDHSERESVRTKKGVKRSGRQRNRRSRSCSSYSSSDDGMREYERIGKRVKRSAGDLDGDRYSRLHSTGDGYQSQERVLNENSSRRLRSVIISKKQCEESDMEHIGRDDQKGEVAKDHDDYPSPRWNGGSIDRETRGEVSYQYSAVAGQLGYLEESNCYKETDGSIINISKHPQSGDHGAMECNMEVSMVTNVRAKDQRVRTLSTGAVSSDVSLESILRQKALENLKKFKCEEQSNPNNPVNAEGSTDGKGKEQVMQNAVIELKKNDQGGNAEGLVSSSAPHRAKFSVVETSKAFNSTVKTTCVSPLSGKPKEEVVSLKKEQLATDALRTTRPPEEPSFIRSSAAKSLQPQAHDSKISVPSGKKRVISLKKEMSSFTHGTTAEGLQPLAQEPKMIPPTRKGRVIILKKGELGSDKFPVQKQPSLVVSAAQNTQTSEIICPVESLGSQPNDPKVLAAHVADKHEAGAFVQCLESDTLKASTTAPAQHNKHVETLQSYPKVLTDDDDKSSTGLSNLQGQSSDAKEAEDEGSQFQQKTMSVMRGGEVVQVSYKVYIPKKAQALARRKLRR